MEEQIKELISRITNKINHRHDVIHGIVEEPPLTTFYIAKEDRNAILRAQIQVYVEMRDNLKFILKEYTDEN